MTPEFRHLFHRLEAPEEFSRAVSGGSLIADFLAPREAVTQVEQFQSSGWAVDFHDARVKARIRCALPSGWGSVGLMRGPAPSHWYGREAHRGALVCTPPGESIDGRITPGFSCLSVTVPQRVWETACAHAGGELGMFGGARIRQLDPGTYRGIERRLLELRRLLRTAATNAPHLAAVAGAEAVAFATELILLATPADGGSKDVRHSPRNRARLVLRAEDWMRAHLGEPIQMPDLCQALGVSRRELEYAFRMVHDESPRAYLHALRLNAVRRHLICNGPVPSVSGIALAHGLTHFGRFAADYRRLFGGNPGHAYREAAGNRSPA